MKRLTHEKVLDYKCPDVQKSINVSVILRLLSRYGLKHERKVGKETCLETPCTLTYPPATLQNVHDIHITFTSNCSTECTTQARNVSRSTSSGAGRLRVDEC